MSLSLAIHQQRPGRGLLGSVQSMNMTKYCFGYLIHRKVDQTGGEITVLFLITFSKKPSKIKINNYKF